MEKITKNYVHSNSNGKEWTCQNVGSNCLRNHLSLSKHSECHVSLAFRPSVMWELYDEKNCYV